MQFILDLIWTQSRSKYLAEIGEREAKQNDRSLWSIMALVSAAIFAAHATHADIGPLPRRVAFGRVVFGRPRLREGKLMLRAIVIATELVWLRPPTPKSKSLLATSNTYYGPGGEILDSPQLRAKDQRAKSQMRSEQRGVEPVSNKGCPSSRAVHVERLIVGHDTSPRRVGGTTITMNRPRARGAASEQTAHMRRCVLGPPA